MHRSTSTSWAGSSWASASSACSSHSPGGSGGARAIGVGVAVHTTQALRAARTAEATGAVACSKRMSRAHRRARVLTTLLHLRSGTAVERARVRASGLTPLCESMTREAPKGLVEFLVRHREGGRRLRECMPSVLCRNRNREHPVPDCVRRILSTRAKEPGAVPPRGRELVAQLVNTVEETRDLLEDNEPCRTRKRITDVRMGVDVLTAEVPRLREVTSDEERSRQRKAATERLADAQDVGDFRAGPHLAQPS